MDINYFASDSEFLPWDIIPSLGHVQFEIIIIIEVEDLLNVYDALTIPKINNK